MPDTIININIGGVPVMSRSQPEPEERQLTDYPLLGGMSPTQAFIWGERAKKKGKGRQKKKCEKGQVCGFSCISKTKTCMADMSTAQFMAHNKAKRAAKRTATGGGVATDQVSKGDALILEYHNGLPDISKKLQDAKVERLKEKGLTEIEAHGVASWIGPGYPDINKTIYAPGSFDDEVRRLTFEAKAARLQDGLGKLDSYDAAAMRAEGKRKGVKPDAFEKDTGLLRRGVSIDDASLDQFLSPYKNAKGGEYVEPTFFATTAKTAHGIADKSNVTFLVRAKDDGTGQGKMVDQFKNDNFEGEVLFPANSRFRVAKVTTKGGLQSSPKSALGGMPEKEVTKLPPSIQAKIQNGGRLSNTEMNELRARTDASSHINELVRMKSVMGDDDGFFQGQISEARAEYRREFKAPALSPEASQLLTKNLNLGRTAVIELEEL